MNDDVTFAGLPFGRTLWVRAECCVRVHWLVPAVLLLVENNSKRHLWTLVLSKIYASTLNCGATERLNATFRARLTSLVRRTRTLARRTATLEHGMWLVGTLYNFCTPHESLRVRGGENRWAARTPAMAAGITDHCWSVKELLWYRVPPPRWRPPRKRGRMSPAMKLKVARWC